MWKKLLVLAVLLPIGGAIAWQYFKPTPPVAVALVEIPTQDLRTTLDINAVVVNTQTVTITALLNGEIGQIVAREGMVVKAGDSLAELKNDRAQSVLDQAVAELAYTEAKLSYTSRSYNRMKNLSGAGNASKQNLDESLDALRGAESSFAVANASVNLAKLDLENANVTAPFAGVITKQFSEAGQWIEAGTRLFELAATDGYLIEAQVDASDWTRVSLGQTVLLSTESAPDLQWESSVEWIAPTVENNNRDAKAVAIRFGFGDDAPPLLLGQEIDAELVLEEVSDVLTIPLSATIELEPNEYSVYVANNDKAELKQISLGLQGATHAEVRDGLTQNDKVITSQGTRLEPNMSVEIQ